MDTNFNFPRTAITVEFPCIQGKIQKLEEQIKISNKNNNWKLAFRVGAFSLLIVGIGGVAVVVGILKPLPDKASFFSAGGVAFIDTLFMGALIISVTRFLKQRKYLHEINKWKEQNPTKEEIEILFQRYHDIDFNDVPLDRLLEYAKLIDNLPDSWCDRFLLLNNHQSVDTLNPSQFSALINLVNPSKHSAEMKRAIAQRKHRDMGKNREAEMRRMPLWLFDELCLFLNNSAYQFQQPYIDIFFEKRLNDCTDIDRLPSWLFEGLMQKILAMQPSMKANNLAGYLLPRYCRQPQGISGFPDWFFHLFVVEYGKVPQNQKQPVVLTAIAARYYQFLIASKSVDEATNTLRCIPSWIHREFWNEFNGKPIPSMDVISALLAKGWQIPNPLFQSWLLAIAANKEISKVLADYLIQHPGKIQFLSKSLFFSVLPFWKDLLMVPAEISEKLFDLFNKHDHMVLLEDEANIDKLPQNISRAFLKFVNKTCRIAEASVETKLCENLMDYCRKEKNIIYPYIMSKLINNGIWHSSWKEAEILAFLKFDRICQNVCKKALDLMPLTHLLYTLVALQSSKKLDNASKKKIESAFVCLIKDWMATSYIKIKEMTNLERLEKIYSSIHKEILCQCCDKYNDAEIQKLFDLEWKIFHSGEEDHTWDRHEILKAFVSKETAFINWILDSYNKPVQPFINNILSYVSDRRAFEFKLFQAVHDNKSRRAWAYNFIKHRGEHLAALYLSNHATCTACQAIYNDVSFEEKKEFFTNINYKFVEEFNQAEQRGHAFKNFWLSSYLNLYPEKFSIRLNDQDYTGKYKNLLYVLASLDVESVKIILRKLNQEHFMKFMAEWYYLCNRETELDSKLHTLIVEFDKAFGDRSSEFKKEEESLKKKAVEEEEEEPLMVKDKSGFFENLKKTSRRAKQAVERKGVAGVTMDIAAIMSEKIKDWRSFSPDYYSEQWKPFKDRTAKIMTDAALNKKSK